MKETIKPILFIVIVFTLAILVGFRLKKMNNYNLDSIKDYNRITIDKKIKVEKKNLKSTEYLKFRNIRIKDEFKNFKLLESGKTKDSKKYALYDKDNKVEASFWMSISDSYITYMKKDFDMYSNDNNKEFDLNSYKNGIKNINSDIELIKYLTENNSIFTSEEKLKERYAINYITNIIFPKINELTIIDGEYEGFILETNNIKEVSLYKDNKRYVFTFINLDYFTKDKIDELLKTIKIQ